MCVFTIFEGAKGTVCDLKGYSTLNTVFLFRANRANSLFVYFKRFKSIVSNNLQKLFQVILPLLTK